MTRYNNFKRKPINPSDDGYESVTTRLPKGIVLKLKRYSVEKKIPWARLIAYALRNEFDQEKPFKFDQDLPLINDENSLSSDFNFEIDLIMKYMAKYFSNGVGLDILLVEREEIGISDPVRLIRAYAEMIYMDIIFETKASSKTYDYNPDMKVAKFTPLTRVDYLKEKPKNTAKGKAFLNQIQGSPLNEIIPKK